MFLESKSCETVRDDGKGISDRYIEFCSFQVMKSIYVFMCHNMLFELSHMFHMFEIRDIEICEVFFAINPFGGSCYC